MKRQLIRKNRLFLTLLLFLFSGCVSTNLVQTMLTDIDRLKADNASLRKDLDELSEEVDTLRLLAVDTDDSPEMSLEDSVEDIPDFLADLTIEDLPEPDVSPPSRPTMLSGEEVYASAQSLYAQSRFREAYQAFSQAVILDTDDEFQARCYYWMGECMYAQAAYQQALDHFGRVFVHYGASSKAADALLKIGFTYYEMKNYNGARQALDEFLRRFPDHRAVPLANERLNRMRYEESGGADD